MVLDDDGARAWATSTRPDVFALATEHGLAGLPAKRSTDGELLL